MIKQFPNADAAKGKMVIDQHQVIRNDKWAAEGQKSVHQQS
jgi:hypothetical protein